MRKVWEHGSPPMSTGINIAVRIGLAMVIHLPLFACDAVVGDGVVAGRRPQRQVQAFYLAAPSDPGVAETSEFGLGSRTLSARARGSKDPRSDGPINVCERFRVEIDRRDRSRFRRIRHDWDQEDRHRFRGLVGMVAHEMGADPRIFHLWASRESTFNPYAVHVLSNDLSAGLHAWQRHRYDPIEEKRLREIMERTGANSRHYWRAKADLNRITRFRDNPHYENEVSYSVEPARGDRHEERRSSWAFGYGPFGFNPTYYLPVWQAEAPPWVFCNEDGLVALISAVWAARTGQRECGRVGQGDSYGVVNRRFSSGHCEPRPRRDALFRKRARGWGIPVDQRAKLGEKWPRKTTDRREILTYMRARALERGLLSPLAVGSVQMQRRPQVSCESTGQRCSEVVASTSPLGEAQVGRLPLP